MDMMVTSSKESPHSRTASSTTVAFQLLQRATDLPTSQCQGCPTDRVTNCQRGQRPIPMQAFMAQAAVRSSQAHNMVAMVRMETRCSECPCPSGLAERSVAHCAHHAQTVQALGHKWHSTGSHTTGWAKGVGMHLQQGWLTSSPPPTRQHHRGVEALHHERARHCRGSGLRTSRLTRAVKWVLAAILPPTWTI